MGIGYELADGIARVRLDDGKANAMSVPFFEELGVQGLGLGGEGAHLYVV